MNEAFVSLRARLADSPPDGDQPRCMLGFDGTVDIICHPVQTRRAPGGDYDAFQTIGTFGRHVVGADGQSALIEIVHQQKKIGGNGPLMAGALAAAGLDVEYVGTLGAPELHPAYAGLSQVVRCTSIGEPAVTHALEFGNGKIMLSALSAYDVVTPARLAKCPELPASLTSAQLVGLFNWACMPYFEDVLQWLIKDVLAPTRAGSRPRWFYFDLTDPSRRSPEEVRRALDLMSAFGRFGKTALGLNYNEVRIVSVALGLKEPACTSDSLETAARAIRSRAGFDVVMAHPTHLAVAAGDTGSFAVSGPFTPTPRITTGAGDHLNAGFASGLVRGFSLAESLAMGVLFSGYYVREGRPPNVRELLSFFDDCLSRQLLAMP